MLQLHPYYYPEGYVGDGEDQEPFENFSEQLNIHDIITNDDYILNMDNVTAQGSILMFLDNIKTETTPALGNLPIDPEDESVYDN